MACRGHLLCGTKHLLCGTKHLLYGTKHLLCGTEHFSRVYNFHSPDLYHFRWSRQRCKTSVLVDSFKIVLSHDLMTPHSQALMTVTDLTSPHSPPSPSYCYNSQQEIKMNKQSAFCGSSGFRKSCWKVTGGRVWHLHRHYNCVAPTDIITVWHLYRHYNCVAPT